MKISIIDESNISGKVLKTNYIDKIAEFDTLDEFASLILSENICTAVFKNSIYVDGWSRDPYINATSLCQKNRWRYDKNCESIDFIAFDFDDGTLPETIMEKFKKFNYVMSASTNHMRDKGDGKVVPRFHIFIKLNASLNCSSLYKFMFDKMLEEYKLDGVDSAVKNIGRYYKKHRETLHVNQGIDLDIKPYKFGYAKQQSSDKFKSLITNRPNIKSPTPVEETKKFNEKIKPLLLNPSGNSNSNYGIFCACSFFKWYGLSENESYDILIKYISTSDLRNIISNIWLDLA